MEQTEAKNNNLKIWEAVKHTDPQFTKDFQRAGGFKGTSIDPLWNIWRATQMWGPMGDRWGAREIENKIVGDLWFSKVELWYPIVIDDEVIQRGTIQQWGGTRIIEKRRDGEFADDEAAKKSFTDAVSKCLSWLGFSADIHLGRFDGSKYSEKSAGSSPPPARPSRERPPASSRQTRQPVDQGPQGPPPPQENSFNLKALFWDAYQDRCLACDIRVPEERSINTAVIDKLCQTKQAREIADKHRFDDPIPNMDPYSTGWQVLQMVIANYDLKGLILRTITESQGAAA